MASIVKVAVIQLYSKPFDVAGNFARGETFIRAAAKQGADLAVLPEYHLQSWRPDYHRLLGAAEASASFLERYRSLARELNLAIVPGTILEPHAPTPSESQDEDATTIANVAYFIGSDGSILGRYQKKNLWHPERPILTADAETPHQAFEWPAPNNGGGGGGVIRVGMLICWDLAFPEAMRELVADGAQMVICPTCWLASDAGTEGDLVNAQSEKVFVESAVVARAFENTCAFVLCNAGGPVVADDNNNNNNSNSSNEEEEEEEEEEGDDVKFLGLSQVAMPLQGALGKLGAEEAMSLVCVDFKVLDLAEEAYKVRADMAKEGWHYAHTLRGQ